MIGNSSSILRTVVDGMTTFEISSAGRLTARGLRMLSGGVEVEAGGIQVRVFGRISAFVYYCETFNYAAYVVYNADPSRWDESGGRPYYRLRWTQPR